MTLFRSPVVCRLVAALVLAGVAVPLAPRADAKGAERLSERLGDDAAVERALRIAAVAPSGAARADAFVRAYLGEDSAEDAYARLLGEAMWLLHEPAPPTAVLTAGPSASSAPAASAATLWSAPPGARALRCLGVAPSPDDRAEATRAPREVRARAP